jgi:hypothetical protein
MISWKNCEVRAMRFASILWTPACREPIPKRTCPAPRRFGEGSGGGGHRPDSRGRVPVGLDLVRQRKVARAVALCPKPVLTGIGHEIDLSVADLVAHTSRKTPTAVAQFLMERARDLTPRCRKRPGLSGMPRGKSWNGNPDRSRMRPGPGAKVRGAPCPFTKQRCLRERKQLRAAARRHLTVLEEQLKTAPARLAGRAKTLLRTNTERLESVPKRMRV